MRWFCSNPTIVELAVLAMALAFVGFMIVGLVETARWGADAIAWLFS